MKKTALALTTALLLASGSAMAQYRLDTVTVRAHPDGGAALSMHCDALYEPNRTDLESVLQIHDPSQTRQLRQKFMVAVAEACNAGTPVIVVERGKDGQSLTWTPVGGYPEYTTTTTTYGPEYPADGYPTTSYPAGSVVYPDRVVYPDGTVVYRDY